MGAAAGQPPARWRQSAHGHIRRGTTLVKYGFRVPANRIGYGRFTAVPLKTSREFITLVVFSAFAVLYLKESLRWNHAAGFVLLVAAAALIFKK